MMDARRAGWLALSAERDAQLTLRHGYWREGYRLGYAAGYAAGGYAAGYEAGRRDEADERDRAWNAIAAPIARGGPAFAELERRRYMLYGEQRTRETFGEPHPADRPGRAAAS
jgi:hypothetical protein